MLFVHNKNQMYFPKVDETFGSNFKSIKIKKEMVERNDSLFLVDYNLKMTRWKSMDTPNKRCDTSNSAASTTGCITKYVESTISCSMNLALGDSKLER